MIKSIVYSGHKPGMRLLVLGAVHGNEVCGTAAIKRVMQEIDAGQIEIACGQATFVPTANSRAYASGQRYLERNLNRYLLPSANPQTYEARLSNILCPMLEACDMLLDLHSYTIGGPPFACLETPDKEAVRLAAAMGAEAAVFGWEEGYAASGRAAANPDEGVGTTAYATRFGAKSVLIECGQHKDAEAVEVAYRAIRRAMRLAGLTAEPALEESAKPIPVLKIAQIYFRTDDGVFAEPWKNLTPVKQGQWLATRADGERIIAPCDAYVILPNLRVDLGAEWFYLGVKAG